MGSAISALNGMRAKPRLYRFKRAEGAKSAPKARKARRRREKRAYARTCRLPGGRENIARKPAVFAPARPAGWQGAKRQAAKAYCARRGAIAEARAISAGDVYCFRL